MAVGSGHWALGQEGPEEDRGRNRRRAKDLQLWMSKSYSLSLFSSVGGSGGG